MTVRLIDFHDSDFSAQNGCDDAKQTSFQGPPGDFANGSDLGMRMMGAPALWAAGITGKGIVVGVIDTGIDDTHPDLKGKVLSHRDYTGDSNPIAAHGTHVAGTIAANGTIKGMAPDAMLRDYRVLNSKGSGQNQWVAQAILDAVADGCHILNLSLGGKEDYQPLHDAIKFAVSKNVLVVCAVGNDGPDHKSYPGYYPEVVGAGAVWVNPGGFYWYAWFSNTNDQVDVAAPGVNIVSTVPGGEYDYMSGTSMATPHVSGFAALMAQRMRDRLGEMPTENALWEAVKSSTVPLNGVGITHEYGAGFVTIFPSLPRVKTVVLTIDKAERVVDGVTEPLDVAPFIQNDRTFAPVRYTHEPMNDQIKWDSFSHTVTITRTYLPGLEPVG